MEHLRLAGRRVGRSPPSITRCRSRSFSGCKARPRWQSGETTACGASCLAPSARSIGTWCFADSPRRREQLAFQCRVVALGGRRRTSRTLRIDNLSAGIGPSPLPSRRSTLPAQIAGNVPRCGFDEVTRAFRYDVARGGVPADGPTIRCGVDHPTAAEAIPSLGAA